MMAAGIQGLPAAFMAAFALVLAVMAWRFFRTEPDQIDDTKAPVPLRDLALFVLCWALLSRLFVLVTAYAVTGFSLPHTLSSSTWTRWDASHYIGIADHWYVSEGDARLHIVFYPLYPLLVMGAKWLFLGRTELAAYVVSNLCFLGCGWALFRLVEMEQGAAAARRAVRYLCLCPVSLFCSLPYSESTFLLLTLLCVLLARQNRLGWAVALGALASCTRMLGLLCAVPIFYEVWRRARGDFSRLAKGFALTCLVALGFLAYLCLNKAVTGDWLRFLTYQREHWSQTFGSLPNTVQYTLANLLDGTDMAARYGVWLPQIVAMALVLLVLSLTWRKVNPGDGAYAALYYYVALAPTWLLSGSRYLGAMYALYTMLAHLTRKRWADAAVTAMMVAGTLYCAVQYAVVGGMF